MFLIKSYLFLWNQRKVTQRISGMQYWHLKIIRAIASATSVRFISLPKYVEGKVAMASGGYGPHGWVEITKDGATYICDPDMQDEAPRYNFYMQPANSPVIKYVR